MPDSYSAHGLNLGVVDPVPLNGVGVGVDESVKMIKEKLARGASDPPDIFVFEDSVLDSYKGLWKQATRSDKLVSFYHQWLKGSVSVGKLSVGCIEFLRDELDAVLEFVYGVDIARTPRINPMDWASVDDASRLTVAQLLIATMTRILKLYHRSKSIGEDIDYVRQVNADILVAHELKGDATSARIAMPHAEQGMKIALDEAVQNISSNDRIKSLEHSVTSVIEFARAVVRDAELSATAERTQKRPWSTRAVRHDWTTEIRFWTSDASFKVWMLLRLTRWIGMWIALWAAQKAYMDHYHAEMQTPLRGDGGRYAKRPDPVGEYTRPPPLAHLVINFLAIDAMFQLATLLILCVFSYSLQTGKARATRPMTLDDRFIQDFLADYFLTTVTIASLSLLVSRVFETSPFFRLGVDGRSVTTPFRWMVFTVCVAAMLFPFSALFGS